MATPLRVLIIEDSEADTIFVVRELQRSGYDVEHLRVETQEELVRALDQNSWDLVIADYSLPRLGGLDALALLRDRHLDIPYIIVSGTIGEDIAVAAMKAGAHDYIIKGNLARLEPAVTRELRDAAIRRAQTATQEQLKTATQLLAKTFESLSEAVFVLDPATFSVLRSNAAAATMFGYTEEEFQGRDLSRLFPDQDGYSRFHEACTTALTSTPGYGTEWRLMHRSGRTLHTEHFVTLLRDDTGPVTAIMHVIRDVTARTLAEEDLRHSERQMRALAARLQSVREEERARIAREIHDELGGAMTGLKMDLAWMQKKIRELGDAARESVLERTALMGSLIDATITAVRRISTELRPGVLDDLGLVAAIEWQAREFEKRTGIECRCRCVESTEIPSQAVATALFRIFQETLTNIARHSRATFVSVVLEEADGTLILSVSDNGRGITEQEIRNTSSLGLVGMQERAEMLGGTFRIAPAAGHGTLVRVTLPHDPGAAGRGSSRPV